MGPKRFLLVVILLGLSGTFAFPLVFKERNQAQTPGGSKSPVILHHYAADKGKHGVLWKIYLEAEDPDGDMNRIASEVEQPGVGGYSVDYITIKPPYQKHFKGYIQWNTFSTKTPFLRPWTQITLRVSILDSAGNRSKEAVFPFEFVSGIGGPQPQPPAPFDQTDLPLLGNIMIDLLEPTLQEPGGHR